MNVINYALTAMEEFLSMQQSAPTALQCNRPPNRTFQPCTPPHPTQANLPPLQTLSIHPAPQVIAPFPILRTKKKGMTDFFGQSFL